MQALENSLPAGTMLDERYCIESILGEGGFGITYKAHDEKLDCTVAIKEYFPGDFAARTSDSRTVQPRTNRIEDYQYGLDHFLQEARVLAKFQHSNIVRVSNFIEQNATAYLVMEFAEGIPLDEWLRKNSTEVNEKIILETITPILKGLVEVHKLGLMHRDIKPGNIFLRKIGGPLLIDFGAARQALGEHSKSLSAIIISVGYAPPEQYTSRGKQGPYTDLYAVGAVIYKMLTGVTPVESPDRSHALAEDEDDPLISMKEAAKGKVSDWLLEITDQLLNVSPKRRPQSAEAVIDALRNKTAIDINGELATRILAPRKDDKTRVVNSGERFNKKNRADAPTQINRPVFRNKTGLIVASVIVVSMVAGGGWWYSKSIEQENNALKSAQKKPAKKPLKYDAILYVDSTPVGAEVFLNNKKVGVTPYKANNLPTGKRQLKLSHKDFKDEVNDINLQSNIILKKRYKLAYSSGTINIFSQPEGASIFIDGVDMQQTTPATLRNIKTGERQLRLHKDRYYDLTGTIQVKKGVTLREEHQLKGGDLVEYNGKWLEPEKMKKEQDKAKKIAQNKQAQKKLAQKRKQEKRKNSARIKNEKNRAMAEKYISRAENEARKFNFKTADSYLKKLIGIAPGHPEIASTQQIIFDYKNKKRQQEAVARRKAELVSQSKKKQQQEEESSPRRSFGGF